MIIYKPKCINELFEIIDEQKLNSENIFFRGDYKELVPTIVNKNKELNVIELLEKERRLTALFQKLAFIKPLFTNKVALKWELRISSREHGLQSILLDFSNNEMIALEFATHAFIDAEIESSNLWIYKTTSNTIILSEQIDNSDFKNSTMISNPKFNCNPHTRRRFVQGGYFLYQPSQNLIIPIDQNSQLKTNLVKIEISKEIKSELHKHLKKHRNTDKNISGDYNLNFRGRIRGKYLDFLCRLLNCYSNYIFKLIG